MGPRRQGSRHFITVGSVENKALRERMADPLLGPRSASRAEPTVGLSTARAEVRERVCPTGSTVLDLAAATGLHPNTVREHLDALARSGLVQRFRRSSDGGPRGRGRPAWLYADPTKDRRPVGAEYADLAATLADQLARTSPDPPAAAEQAGRRWGAKLVRDRAEPTGSAPAAPDSPADDPDQDARQRVVGLLRNLHFDAEPTPDARRVRLRCCPLLEAARSFPEIVCGVHLGLVRGALAELPGGTSATDLVPFAEPGACVLHLAGPVDRRSR